MQLSVTNEYWSLFSSAVILTASVRGGCRFQIGGIPPYLPDKQTPYGYISYSHIRMNTLKHKPGVSNLSYLSTKYQLIGFQAQEKMDRLPSTLSGPSRTCPQHFPLSQLPLLKTKGVLFPFHYALNIMSVSWALSSGGRGWGRGSTAWIREWRLSLSSAPRRRPLEWHTSQTTTASQHPSLPEGALPRQCSTNISAKLRRHRLQPQAARTRRLRRLDR